MNYSLEKKLIIIAALIFIASALFLFWQNERELDSLRGKNWWAASFAEPGNRESLDIGVANYSGNPDFRYEVTAGTEVLAGETFSVQPGAEQAVHVSVLPQTGTRTQIRIFHGTEKQELFREIR